MGEEAAAGEPILSGIGLSGSEKEESDSNLLSVSTAAVVSNKDNTHRYLFDTLLFVKPRTSFEKR